MSDSIDWVKLTETPYVKIPDDVLRRYAQTGDSQAEIESHWIEVAAYYIWLEEGCPHGRDQEHWDRALRQFLERPDNQ